MDINLSGKLLPVFRLTISARRNFFDTINSLHEASLTESSNQG